MYSACDKKRRCGVRLNRQKIGRNPHSWYDKHVLPGRQMSTRGPSEVRKSSLRGPQVRVTSFVCFKGSQLGMPTLPDESNPYFTSKYMWCLLELLEGSVRSSQLILCANLLFCHDQLWQVYKTALLTGNTGAQTFKVPLKKFCSQYILPLNTYREKGNLVLKIPYYLFKIFFGNLVNSNSFHN